MSQGRSIIDIIQDPAALDAFLRSSAKSSTNGTGSPRSSTNTGNSSSPHSTDQPRLSATNVTTIGNNIYNQNTTNNTNVQITQNTFNFNTNPSLTTVPQQQPIASTEVPRVLSQTIGSQTNVNVFLNQTVIQQPSVQTTTSNQQQMVAININGNQTLIPLSMFTKLLQPKQSSTPSIIPSTTTMTNTIAAPGTSTSVTQPNQIVQNGTGSVLVQNLPNNQPPGTTTVRFVRPPSSTPNNPTTTTTSNLMTMSSGQRLASPLLTKSQTGNIIFQVTSNDTTQSKSMDKTSSVSTNSDLTTQLMNDLQANGKDPEKQITLIDSYLSRMHSSTEKDREFSTRIIRYRETLSHSVEQARLNGQHRQRLLNQTTTLNTLSSNPAIKREQPSVTQQKSNGTTLIQLPLAKQDELLNAVLKKLRHVNLQDLQAQGILPMELTFEQKLQIQKLDMQIAALPIDKQQQFARGQRELVPKYLAKNAASGLNTTSTLTVNPRTKILLGAPPGTAASLNNAANGNARSLRISSADLIGQQLRKDQAHVLKPDFKSRFLTRGDAIKRLTRYHVFTKPASPAYEPTDDECQQFDDAFENDAKRLLTASDRISESISRFAVVHDQFNNEACDKYLFEKMRLDDLREQLEVEKTAYETRKKRALDVQSNETPFTGDMIALQQRNSSDRPTPMPIRTAGASPRSTFDFLSAPPHPHEALMSDAAYFDLFNSDPISDEPGRASDETQLAINSIVDYGVIEPQEPQIDIPDPTNFFFDDLDLDNSHQENNPSQDDEASRAVQNLLGFS